MPCTYCKVQFTLLKWKITCSACTRKHCTECMVGPKCRSCHLVQATRFQRTLLMKVKVKDLQIYLKNRSCSTETFREKRELVRLIQLGAGVHEPDLENHTGSYDTTYHASEHPTDHTRTGSSPTPSDRSSSPDMLDDIFSPPTYRETQDSFPTAQEYSQAGSSSTQQRVHVEETVTATSKHSGGLLDISDLTSVGEIQTLSIRQLKHLLNTNLVNYQGILERHELVNRVINLYEVNQKDLSSVDKGSPSDFGSEPAKDENFCKICWDNPVNCVYLECGHMVTCIECSKAVKECPICRQHIVRTVRVFKS